MAIHVAFPSIEQFRTVVKNVRDRANYHGQPLPKLKFKGTVKLHGTNASIVKDVASGEFWVQSRNNVITVDADNAGFARFVQDHRDEFDELISISRTVVGQENIHVGDKVVIYGEWCGQGIQSGVAISQMPKAFVIFAIKLARDDEKSVWFTADQLVAVADRYGDEHAQAHRIFNIQKFPSWEVEIDFARPEQIQNDLIALTHAVEQECPVGKAFGHSGIGEGIVWQCMSVWNVPAVDADTFAIRTGDLIFKVKGEKHSDTKVKKLAAVDVEKINSIKEFVGSVVTDHRLSKGIDFLMEGRAEALESKDTPAFLKWVGADVLKEESDTIDASGFDRKEIMPEVNRAARQWFLEKVNKV